VKYGLPLEKIGLPTTIEERQAARMYYTTGFTKAVITELHARIEARELAPGMRRWPPILGLRNALTVTLTYMRRNRVQAEIAEAYAVSQPTISRAISAITPLLVQALLEYIPTADELDPRTCYIVDGTLLPCWSWAARPELYSGKHKTTGMNILVACTLSGDLAWISDPVDGSRHDTHCLSVSGVLTTLNPGNWAGDKGFVGYGMITPFKKPAGGELLDWQKEYNTQVNKIRYVIEQVIANFKTWRIMHTDYRRPIETFPETISAVVGLHFYKLA
jgi:DDE superfamily endonuclease/Helix-turn-helix of DDE superfamily endonuclease